MREISSSKSHAPTSAMRAPRSFPTRFRPRFALEAEIVSTRDKCWQQRTSRTGCHGRRRPPAGWTAQRRQPPWGPQPDAGWQRCLRLLMNEMSWPLRLPNASGISVSPIPSIPFVDRWARAANGAAAFRPFRNQLRQPLVTKILNLRTVFSEYIYIRTASLHTSQGRRDERERR